MIGRLKAWADIHLILGWQHFLKLWSVRLAVLNAAMMAVFVPNAAIALALLPFLPKGAAQVAVAVAIGCVVFIIPTIVRLWDQSQPPPRG